MTLKSLIDMLPEKGFLRIHRSFVVAADKVVGFNKKEVGLSNGKVLLCFSQNIIDIPPPDCSKTGKKVSLRR